MKAVTPDCQVFKVTTTTVEKSVFRVSYTILAFFLILTRVAILSQTSAYERKGTVLRAKGNKAEGYGDLDDLMEN